MQRFLALLAVALLSACGPDGIGGSSTISPTISIKNEYAESLFTLRYEVPASAGGSAKAGVVFDAERIGSGQTAKAEEVFEAPRDGKARLTLSAMSLGEARNFAPIEVDLSKASIRQEFRITYDYDLATAKFRIEYGWE